MKKLYAIFLALIMVVTMNVSIAFAASSPILTILEVLNGMF